MTEQFGMRTRAALISAVLLFFLTTFGAPETWAESPDTAMETALTTFRVTTGEVHVAVSAVKGHGQPLTELSTADFVLMRDGKPVKNIVSFGKNHEMPVSALVLTDVSESMKPGLKLERDAAQWLAVNADPMRDRLRFLDFGVEVSPAGKSVESHLTSLYDSLVKTIPDVTSQGAGRRVLILLTDGDDNSSCHGLNDVVTLAQKFDVALYAITAHPSRKQYVAEETLEALTSETGGRFYEVRNLREMEAALTSIREELTNGYELVFRPEASQTGMHQLEIRPVNGKVRFFYRAAYFQPENMELAAR